MDDSSFLAREKEGRLLLKFAVPCVLSLIISCLYNIVDQVFVGHGVGPLANAATGVVFPVTVVGWGISLFFGDGAAAYLSVSLGKGQTEKLPRLVANAVLGSFFFGLVLIAASYIAGDGLLMLLGGTEKNIGYAHDYAMIIYAMMPLALVQNTLAAIIRADGSPRFAMVSMVVGAVINMVGDPIAIFALNLGISGAAYATILGQFVSLIICLAYLKRSKTFRLEWKSFIPDLFLLGKIAKLGLSSFMTQLCIVVTTIVNNVLFVRYGALWNEKLGGDVAISAFVVIMKLFQIVLNVAIGIAAGAQPIVGYNYGEKKFNRVKKLLILVVGWTAGLSLLCTVCFEAFPSAFIAMFGGAKGDAEFAKLYNEFAISCIRIYLMFIALGCLQKVSAIFLQSIGLAKLAVPLSFLRDGLLILFAFLLPLRLGVLGVAWAAPAADLASFLITAPVMIWLWHKLGKEDGDRSAAENPAP